MIQETFHQFNRNGKTQALAESDLHVGHPDNLAGKIEQWATAVAGVDLRARLQVEFAFQFAGLGAQDALRDRALQAERAADGKDRVTNAQGVGTAQGDGLELGRVPVLDLQQRQVMKLVDGNDLDLFVNLAVKVAVGLTVDFHGNLRLALNDVKIGDEKTVGIDEKARAQALRGTDLHDRFTNLFDQRTDVPRDERVRARIIKLSAVRQRRGRRRIGVVRPDNTGDDITRHDQHGVTDVNDDGIGLFRQDFPRDGVLVLELDGVGKIELRAASQQRGDREMFL